MAKCKKCLKQHLFLKLNDSGLCPACAINQKLDDEKNKLELEISTAREVLHDINKIKEDAKTEALQEISLKIETLKSQCASLAKAAEDQDSIFQLKVSQCESEDKKLLAATKRLWKIKEAYKSIQHSIELYENSFSLEPASITVEAAEELISTTISLKLNCMNLKQLKALYVQNRSVITETLKRYEKRYTTKTNKSIYKLMVVALEAELQNALYDLKYGTLEKAIKSIKDLTSKYYSFSIEGSQTIATTMQRFIGEIEYLFVEAIKIEYEYYTQKQRIKEEQRTLREQIKQEQSEMKRLALEQKRIEAEESKYISEISSINELLTTELDSIKADQLTERLQDLQKQLCNMMETKAEILNLQNGKAGYVYIISNIGSFGETVFKVGMTRRLEPMERVNELGDASVPFPFDVHSFIFSDDAVSLERNMHIALNDRRLNKVNLRREFFSITIEELEEFVYSIEPTAEFNKTMLAEQYNQSLSTDVVRETIIDYDDDDNDESFEDGCAAGLEI